VAGRPLFFAVDDEAHAQRWYTRVLAVYGDVLVAPTAAVAREQLAKRPAVSGGLFDICLPDGSGLDVLEEFRRFYPTTPAIVVTGHVAGDIVNAAYDLDADVLAKPFNRDRLHHWVERVIACQSAARNAPQADALADRIAALKALLARRPCDARVRYGIGEIVAGLKKQSCLYGAGAVATAAAAVGEALPSLYRHARVAQRWTVGEFDGLLARTMADGRSFSWSHFVSLAGVSAGELYDHLVERALVQSWTVKELDVALAEAGFAAPLSVGRGGSE